MTVGTPSNIAKRDPVTSTDRCEDGRIGTISVVPSRGNRAEFAVRIVAGIGKTARECERSGFLGGCIVARRTLKFVPEHNLRLPITLEVACIDVPCGATETCRAGQCLPARLDDPSSCTDPLLCSRADGSSADGGMGANDAGGLSEGGGGNARDGGPDTTDAGPFGGASGCVVGESPYLTIQSAIDDASCSRVLVKAGRWLERLSIQQQRNVEVWGEGKAATVVDAEQMGVAVTIASGANVLFKDLTITGGLGTSLGGGIANQGNLSLSGAEVTGNHVRGQTGRGAGIATTNANVTLRDGTRIADNMVEDDGSGDPTLLGAGLYATGTLTVVVGQGVVIEGNRLEAIGSFGAPVVRGAGVYLGPGATLQVTGSGVRFENNEALAHDTGTAGGAGATAEGGALYCSGGSLSTAQQTSFLSNKATAITDNTNRCFAKGAAVTAVSGCQLAIDRTSLAQNVTYSECGGAGESLGGALAIDSSSLTLQASTLQANETTAKNHLALDNTRSARGGALRASSSSVEVASSTFTLNQVACSNVKSLADCAGGAIDVSATSIGSAALLRMYGSTVGPENSVVSQSGSSAGAQARAFGGGVALTLAEATASFQAKLVNCTITTNSVSATGQVHSSGGGGVSIAGSTDSTSGVALFSSTLALNDPGGSSALGGGLHVQVGTTQNHIAVAHCAFGGNVGAANAADIACNAGEAVVFPNQNHFASSAPAGTCDTSAGYPVSLMVNDPGYTPQPLSDNGGETQTHALLANDKGVNAGAASGCVDPVSLAPYQTTALTIDQRGSPRTGACDLGSFER